MISEVVFALMRAHPGTPEYKVDTVHRHTCMDPTRLMYLFGLAERPNRHENDMKVHEAEKILSVLAPSVLARTGAKLDAIGEGMSQGPRSRAFEMMFTRVVRFTLSALADQMGKGRNDGKQE